MTAEVCVHMVHSLQVDCNARDVAMFGRKGKSGPTRLAFCRPNRGHGQHGWHRSFYQHRFHFHCTNEPDRSEHWILRQHLVNLI